MRDKLEQRINQLKTEFASGQQMLADLEAQQASLRETLLRISGAIQILEEILAGPQEDPEEESAPPPSENGVPSD